MGAGVHSEVWTCDIATFAMNWSSVSVEFTLFINLIGFPQE